MLPAFHRVEALKICMAWGRIFTTPLRELINLFTESLGYLIFIKFRIERYPVYYELVAVVPSILVTIISILSFWIRDLGSRLKNLSLNILFCRLIFSLD